MSRRAPIQVRSYRRHRLEIRDEGEGWTITIWPRRGEVSQPETLRNRTPGGLSVLLQEAQDRIDARTGNGPSSNLPL
jgi:hypothetical protein